MKMKNSTITVIRVDIQFSNGVEKPLWVSTSLDNNDIQEKLDWHGFCMGYGDVINWDLVENSTVEVLGTPVLSLE